MTRFFVEFHSGCCDSRFRGDPVLLRPQLVSSGSPFLGWLLAADLAMRPQSVSSGSPLLEITPSRRFRAALGADR